VSPGAACDGSGCDAELLAAHVGGDPEAFGLLVQRHSRDLWSLALRTAGDPDDAADAVQEALVSAYRRAATYRGEASVRTWLRRIVVNACIDRIRHERGRRTVPWPRWDLPARGADPGTKILQVPAGTVKSRCARGRARLALLLGHLREEGG
jgi:RNA polymerase sigma-70 factor, ECF subfamily